MEKKLIFLSPEKSTFFQGKGRLNVVYGSCNIFGANLSQDMNFFIDFHSLQFSYEVVCLETGNQKKKINFKEKKFLENYEKELNSKNLKETSCVIYFEFDQLEFTKSDKKIRINEDIITEENLSGNILLYNFDQKFYLSTFLLNTFLQTKKEVLVINLDPILNGTISLTRHNKPTLLPYWMIIQYEKALFIGNLKYEDNFEIFNQFSKELLSNIKKERVIIISMNDNLPIFKDLENLSSVNSSNLIENRMSIDNYFSHYFLNTNIEILPFSQFIISLSQDNNVDILSDIMYLLNGLTIGLSKVKKLKNETNLPLFLLKYPLENVHGFGIIRKIDMNKSYFYIESPLKNLKEMNLIFVGKINDSPTFATHSVELKNKGMSGVMTKKKFALRESQKKTL